MERIASFARSFFGSGDDHAAEARENKLVENPYLNDILNNWSSKPIHEIYLAKNDETCEKNFLNLEWEGVPFSCDCKNSNNSSVKGSTFKGQCNTLKILLG